MQLRNMFLGTALALAVTSVGYEYMGLPSVQHPYFGCTAITGSGMNNGDPLCEIFPHTISTGLWFMLLTLPTTALAALFWYCYTAEQQQLRKPRRMSVSRFGINCNQFRYDVYETKLQHARKRRNDLL